MDPRQEVKSLLKGLKALTLINARGPLGVTEVARGLECPRTTAHRILETLVRGGYLHRDDELRRYRLAAGVEGLSSGFAEEDWIAHCARPAIEQLSEVLHWPLSLATQRVDRMIVRISTDSQTTMAIDRFGPGYEAPLLHTTSGLCVLAYQKPQQRKVSLDAIALSRDPKQHLIHNKGHLESLIAKTYADGYCIIDHPEYSESNISVPVFRKGQVVGGLIMRYIKRAIQQEELVRDYLPSLRDTARRISNYTA